MRLLIASAKGKNQESLILLHLLHIKEQSDHFRNKSTIFIVVFSVRALFLIFLLKT
ncbi:hypothetical protein NECAME_15127 [Necator americanus]|uniref:Uncharacterized protein n=1 Tax=Necator americanus TaxID=51031 RepID=W2SLK1_NECAM|nr:hypothetical protein NECAME_15127 [Necator americanus]ETN69741.1 hypothetical protein NECAME_15127 [Necator americanus]